VVAGFEKGAEDRVTLVGVLEADALQVSVKNLLGLAHGFACGRSVVVNAALEHATGL